MTWLEGRDKPVQGAVLGRIINWFVSQPVPVQRVVLGEVENEMTSAYAAMLRQMADSLEAGGESEGIRTRGNAALLPSTKNKPADR